MSRIVLRGLEGSNPLAFLAALGTARLCELMWRGVRMRWVRESGWRPEILGIPAAGEGEFCRTLEEQAPWAPMDAFAGLGKNLTVKRDVFAEAVEGARRSATACDRRTADFAAAFGSEAVIDEKNDRIRYTDFCFITGSGHQDFLGTANGLAASCKGDHLQEALFGPWRFADDGLSMRWDPDDAKEYALRWRNPSVTGVCSVWGANRLAFEALPLFSTAATEKGLRTVGFGRRNELTWPIWSRFVSLETIRSLLTLPDMQEDAPDRGRLWKMGIEEVFRVQRVRIGQGANFKVSFRPARSV